jgi:TPP-dependent trihydroxycyclohexane-1,2-dione (THcHDO) dehydratase
MSAAIRPFTAFAPVPMAGMRPDKCVAIPRLVDRKRPAAEFLAVKIRNGAIRIFHVHKTKTAGAVTLAVCDDLQGTHGADFLKMKFEVRFGCVMGKVADKYFLDHSLSLFRFQKQ